MSDNVYENTVVAFDKLQALINLLSDRDYDTFGGVAESIIEHHRHKINQLVTGCGCLKAPRLRVAA